VSRRQLLFFEHTVFWQTHKMGTIRLFVRRMGHSPPLHSLQGTWTTDRETNAKTYSTSCSLVTWYGYPAISRRV